MWKRCFFLNIFLLGQKIYFGDAFSPRISDPLDVVGSIPIDVKILEIPKGKITTVDTDVPGEPLGPEDFNRGFIEEGPDFPAGIQRRMDPIELAGLYQGDIFLTQIDDVDQLSTRAQTSGRLRNAIVNIDRRWVNGVVPYVISGAYDKNARGIIAQAMQQFHNKTCINFIPRTIETDYIHLLGGDGCSSAVGRTAGVQIVSLGIGCLYVGIVQHELMHVVGFWHEQSRADRDKYIQIVWNNIQTGMEFNFNKFNKTDVRNMGVAYDSRSIMHYGPYAFAKDRHKPTIIPINPSPIGQREGFSMLDEYKIEKLYACYESRNATTAAHQPSPPPDVCRDNHSNCKMWSRSGECQKNPIWMEQNCQKSCEKCQRGCGDFHTSCKKWANDYECTKNPPYMMLFCKKSCGLCKVIDTKTGCQDHNPHCQQWSTTDQCTIHPQIMKEYCPKVCKTC